MCSKNSDTLLWSSSAVSPLDIGVEQHAPAQLLVVRVHTRLRLAVVDRNAEAEGEEGAPRTPLPARVEVGLAGEALEVDGGAERRPQRAARRSLTGRTHLDVEIDAVGLLVEAAPQVGHVVHLRADLHVVDEALRALHRRVPSCRRAGDKRTTVPPMLWHVSCGRLLHAHERPQVSIAGSSDLRDGVRRRCAVDAAFPKGTWPKCHDSFRLQTARTRACAARVSAAIARLQTTN